MTEIIYILDEFVDLKKIDFDKINLKTTKFFSLDFSIHNALKKMKIIHTISDDFLDLKTRDQIFEKVIEWHNWYNNIKSDLDFNGINLLSMLDTNEFHTYVIHRLIQFQTIKNILKNEKPQKIFSPHSLSSIITSFIDSSKISILNGAEDKEKLAWDELNIILKIGPFPLPIKISRKKYNYLKNLFEKIVGDFFHLWFDPKKNSKIILFLEFNPSVYDELVNSFKNHETSPVFLNLRRSAVWNFASINALRKNNAKIVNIQKLLDSKTKNSLNNFHRKFVEKFNEFWKNDESLLKQFVFDGVSLWPSIKHVLIKTYEKRLYEYLTLISLGINFFKTQNIQCVVSLNEVGETEKAILNLPNNLKPSILLEHGFANYLPEISMFDSPSYYNLLRDKIAVWGEFQKNYLCDVKKIPEDKILTIGSPRHDNFFRKIDDTHVHKTKKTLLLTTHPIMDLIGRGGILDYEKFEFFLRNLINAKKTFSDLDLIVKLHPSPDPQHEHTKNFLKKLDPTIKIFQTTPILDLINDSDAMINVSEFYSPSTSIMESMILNKPVVYVSLYEKEIPFDFIKKNAVLSISADTDLPKAIHDILYNENKREEIINNAQSFLNDYLSNPGTSSKNFSKVLSSL